VNQVSSKSGRPPPTLFANCRPSLSKASRFEPRAAGFALPRPSAGCFTSFFASRCFLELMITLRSNRPSIRFISDDVFVCADVVIALAAVLRAHADRVCVPPGCLWPFTDDVLVPAARLRAPADVASTSAAVVCVDAEVVCVSADDL
jgi:hypothetical protein